MPRIPDHLIEEIVSKTDFVALLGQYLTLRPQGRKFIALCPFHGEKTPSLSVDPDQGVWYCFGCHAGGNMFKFLMQIEGWTFQETARELGKRVGVEVDQLTPEERLALNRKQQLRDLMRRAAELYHHLLLKSAQAEAARRYLSGRGIGAGIIDSFQIGFAPSGPCYLMEWAAEQKIEAEDLVACGLATDRTRSGRTVDTFRERVTFPIVDAHGQPIAMGGRILGEGQPKYLNSPETALYSKRSNLYGLHQARHVLRESSAILVEGYMDVVALHQAGFTQAVASLGTALTEQQAGLLRRYCESCVLAYDADNAGQAATEKGIEIFEAAGLTASVVTMPAGDDPDSLIKRSGRAAFEERLAAAHSIVEYTMDLLQTRLPVKSAEGKSQFLREIMPILKRVRSQVRKEVYCTKISELINVKEETVRAMAGIQAALPPPPQFTPYRRASGRAPEERPNLARDIQILKTGRRLADARSTRSAVPEHEQRADRSLVGYLLAHPEALEEAQTTVRAEDLHDDTLRRILARLYELKMRQRSLRAADLLALLHQEGAPDQEGVDKRISELLLGEKSEPLTPQLFAGLLKSFQVRRDKAELESLKPIIEKGNKERSIKPDDPMYIKFMQLKSRLKGST